MFNLFLDFSVAVIKLYLSSDNEYYDLGLQKNYYYFALFNIYYIYCLHCAYCIGYCGVSMLRIEFQFKLRCRKSQKSSCKLPVS